jgi:hypothetical protein
VKVIAWKWWSHIAAVVWLFNYIVTQSLWALGLCVLFITAAAVEEIYDAYKRGATVGRSDDKR